MNAFMTVAVSREGSDSYELADFVNDTMVPYIERQGGVSNISANGLVTRIDVYKRQQQDGLLRLHPRPRLLPARRPAGQRSPAVRC